MPDTTLQHPLFDPASLYCRMRDTIDADGKMLGYLLWRKAKVAGVGDAAPQRTAEEREAQCQEFTRCYRVENGVGPLAVLDASDPLACQVWHPDQFATLRIRIALVGEANRTRSIRAVTCDGAVPRGRYRALLIEPEARRRFVEIVGTALGSLTGDAVHAAFDPEVMAKHIDVARLIASLPDLDGESAGGTLRLQIGVPGEIDSFPPRPAEALTVVLVCDSEGHCA